MEGLVDRAFRPSRRLRRAHHDRLADRIVRHSDVPIPPAAAGDSPMMRARRGMTLMELVIGLTITGMMATAGAVAFGSIIDHRQIIRTATVETERAAAMREMIRGWINAGSIQIQQGGGPRGLNRGVGPAAAGPAQRLGGGLNTVAAVS